MPADWLPPNTYDFYILSSMQLTDDLMKHLQNKEVIVVLYQNTVDTYPISTWVEKGYINRVLPKYAQYIDAVSVFEEMGAITQEHFDRLNAVYDYVKTIVPDMPVYQWPHSNKMDFKNLGKLKADGWIIDPRWWWSSEFPSEYGTGWPTEQYFFYPTIATGKPIINVLSIGVGSELLSVAPWYKWEYAIGQYKLDEKYGIRTAIYEPWYLGWEDITKERLQIIK